MIDHVARQLSPHSVRRGPRREGLIVTHLNGFVGDNGGDMVTRGEGGNLVHNMRTCAIHSAGSGHRCKGHYGMIVCRTNGVVSRTGQRRPSMMLRVRNLVYHPILDILHGFLLVRLTIQFLTAAPFSFVIAAARFLLGVRLQYTTGIPHGGHGSKGSDRCIVSQSHRAGGHGSLIGCHGATSPRGAAAADPSRAGPAARYAHRSDRGGGGRTPIDRPHMPRRTGGAHGGDGSSQRRPPPRRWSGISRFYPGGHHGHAAAPGGVDDARVSVAAYRRRRKAW
mmetsp:Transcript_1639/g.3599  ORF Transcript_1639/g.3599 Transcript_1639/m.3599 type:complete len:280 (+) Transcript_1639:209-1048(+)